LCSVWVRPFSLKNSARCCQLCCCMLYLKTRSLGVHDFCTGAEAGHVWCRLRSCRCTIVHWAWSRRSQRGRASFGRTSLVGPAYKKIRRARVVRCIYIYTIHNTIRRPVYAGRSQIRRGTLLRCYSPLNTVCYMKSSSSPARQPAPPPPPSRPPKSLSTSLPIAILTATAREEGAFELETFSSKQAWSVYVLPLLSTPHFSSNNDTPR